MQLKGRALFNLLRINWLEDPTSIVKVWQVEDLRDLSIEELFSRLKELRVILNEENFYLYAENCSSPEELVDLIWMEEEDLEGYDQVYLLLFELWRRLIPDQFCLSVFCDELDQLIESYDRGELENEEALQNGLRILEDILDDAYDKEKKSQKVFTEVASYCAHDLERFLFDYIADQIAENNETYASELIDAFYDYASDRIRFDLLRARLLSLFNLEESSLLYSRILEEVRERPDLEILLLAAEGLVHHGGVGIFMQVIKQALPLIKTEEEFQNLLGIIAEYYRCLDRDEDEKVVKNLLESRSTQSLKALIDPSDRALARISHLISI